MSPDQSRLTDDNTRNLVPLTEWPNRHSWPSLGGLRHLVFNAGKNGFDAVIRRVAGRVLIDEAAFYAWADEQDTAATERLCRSDGR